MIASIPRLQYALNFFLNRILIRYFFRFGTTDIVNASTHYNIPSCKISILIRISDVQDGTKATCAGGNMLNTEFHVTFAPRYMTGFITLRNYMTASLRFTSILCKENTILRQLRLPKWRLMSLHRSFIFFTPNNLTLHKCHVHIP
jgi:hypothetical protein